MVDFQVTKDETYFDDTVIWIRAPFRPHCWSISVVNQFKFSWLQTTTTVLNRPYSRLLITSHIEQATFRSEKLKHWAPLFRFRNSKVNISNNYQASFMILQDRWNIIINQPWKITLSWRFSNEFSILDRSGRGITKALKLQTFEKWKKEWRNRKLCVNMAKKKIIIVADEKLK